MLTKSPCLICNTSLGDESLTEKIEAPDLIEHEEFILRTFVSNFGIKLPLTHANLKNARIDWNLKKESLPFCTSCERIVENLVELCQQLETIRHEIELTKTRIRSEIVKSNKITVNERESKAPTLIQSQNLTINFNGIKNEESEDVDVGIIEENLMKKSFKRKGKSLDGHGCKDKVEILRDLIVGPILRIPRCDSLVFQAQGNKFQLQPFSIAHLLPNEELLDPKERLNVETIPEEKCHEPSEPDFEDNFAVNIDPADYYSDCDFNENYDEVIQLESDNENNKKHQDQVSRLSASKPKSKRNSITKSKKKPKKKTKRRAKTELKNTRKRQKLVEKDQEDKRAEETDSESEPTANLEVEEQLHEPQPVPPPVQDHQQHYEDEDEDESSEPDASDSSDEDFKLSESEEEMLESKSKLGYRLKTRPSDYKPRRLRKSVKRVGTEDAFLYDGQYEFTGSKLVGFKCSLCPTRKFSRRGLVQAHIREFHIQDDPDECSNNVLCTICGKMFRSTHGLERHLDVHKEKRKVCLVCGNKFRTDQLLQFHMKRDHRDPSDLQVICEYCGKVFKTRQQANVHVQAVHMQKKRHFCDQCGKGFFSTSGVASHMASHSTEKPFPCEFCPQRFNRKCHRDRHEKQFHGYLKETNDGSNPTTKTIETPTTNVTQQNPNNEEMEIKDRNPSKASLKCKLCGLQYNRQNNLTRHLLQIHNIDVKGQAWKCKFKPRLQSQSSGPRRALTRQPPLTVSAALALAQPTVTEPVPVPVVQFYPPPVPIPIPVPVDHHQQPSSSLTPPPFSLFSSDDGQFQM